MAATLPAWKKSLFGASFAALLLICAEGGLRLAGLPDPGLYAGDPNTLWWLRPALDREVPGPQGTFHVRTGPEGLRGPSPPPSGPWTLALGCSTTFGWGVEAEQAWPAQLAQLVGQPVINGGQPGWSSHQARLGAGRWLALGPSRVIIGYIVRDAQLAPRPDREARAQHPLWGLSLSRALLGLRPAGPPAAAPTGQPRVSAQQYAQNLKALIAEAAPAEVWLLAFPMVEPAHAWRESLEGLGPRLLSPELPREAFFRDDPIHLTVEGHERLARALAPALETP
jgi:hypothetical protein